LFNEASITKNVTYHIHNHDWKEYGYELARCVAELFYEEF